MTELTDDAVKALLDGAYPGPYEIEGRAGHLELMDAKGHIFGCVEWSLGNSARDSATAALLIAAPDLARALLAARAERDSIGAMYATVAEENKALEAECTRLRDRERVLKEYYDAVEALDDKPWKDEIEVMAARVRAAKTCVRAALKGDDHE